MSRSLRTTSRRAACLLSFAALATTSTAVGTASAETVLATAAIGVTTSNTNVSATASCVRTDAPGDFGTFTVSGTVNVTPPVGGSVRVDQVDKLSNTLLSSTTIAPGQPLLFSLSTPADGMSRIKPVKVLTYTVSASGAQQLRNQVATTGQCGWSDPSYVPPVVDMRYYEDNAGRQDYKVVNASDFRKTFHLYGHGTFFGTNGYIGSTGELVRQTVTLDPGATTVVPSTGLLPYGPCGVYTAYTAAGAGINAADHPYESAPRTESWDLRDGHNGGLNC